MTHNKSVTPDSRDAYLSASNTSCRELSISEGFIESFSQIQLIKVNLMKKDKSDYPINFPVLNDRR